MVSAHDKGCGIAAQVVGNGSLGEQEPALGATGESFMDRVRCFLKSLSMHGPNREVHVLFINEENFSFEC